MGYSPVARHYWGNHCLFSLPAGTKMFQFPAFASALSGYQSFRLVGCPIRKSPDQRSFAPPRSLSQLITSFIACESLGIRHTPFPTFARTELAFASSVDYTFSFFSFTTSYIIKHMTRRFALHFCFRFQYVKDRLGIAARSGNPRAWTSVPGRFPFSYI